MVENTEACTGTKCVLNTCLIAIFHVSHHLFATKAKVLRLNWFYMGMWSNVIIIGVPLEFQSCLIPSGQ